MASTQGDRELAALVYMLQLGCDLEKVKVRNDQVHLPAGRLLTELNALLDLDLKLTDLRRHLLEAGLLKATPGRQVVVSVAAWERAVSRHQQLLPA